ncbi:MAG: DNA helicase Rep [Pseudomonadales bacterium]
MSKLNRQQQQAIVTNDRPLLVLAGAGSGKTTVITHKIAHLVNKVGIDPRHIYAVTFTNKAAREMKERVSKQLKGEAAKGISVSTFHNLGLNIIRKEYKHLDIKPGFSLFDAHDALTLIKELLPKEGDQARELANQAQHQISNWKNAMLEPEDALSMAKTGNDMTIAKVYGHYNRMLRAYNAVDFDDLILLPTRLFVQQPDILDRWQDKIRYLLVDEYQDTNESQYLLVKQLVGVRQAFTVVGDDDQSIYAWRGAVPENLARLQSDFPRLEVIKLEQNYRSCGCILKAANQVIANNEHMFDKKLWCDIGFGDPIRIIQCDDEEAEAERIATEIVSQRLQKRSKFEDFAVLYRGNYQSRILELKLQQFQVPYHISGGTSFFEKAEVKDMLAYLRLIANPDDDTAFLRVINVPRRQIGPSTLEALGQYATERDTSLYCASNELGLEQHLKPQHLDKLRRFRHWLDSIVKRWHQLDFDDVVKEMIDELDYDSWLEQNSSSRPVADRRLANVWFLMDTIKRNLPEDSQQDPVADLADALSRLMLQDMLERQQDEADKNQVQLMTMHAAKGLEFPHVFIMGLEEELLPHRNSIESENIPEERRLFYVGITRAQKTLALTLARKRKQYGETIDTAPSRFLDELPKEDLEWEGGSETNPQAKRARGNNAIAGLRNLMDMI